MNQKALVVYLKNLRDLETAKERLKKIFHDERSAFEQENEALRKTCYLRYYKVDLYRYFNMNCCIICAICFSACIFLFRSVSFSSFGERDIFTLALSLTCFCLGVGCFVRAMMRYLKARRSMHAQNQRARTHNHKEHEKIKENELLRREKEAAWEKRREYLNEEIDKVDALLDEAYSLNLLPDSYHNLVSVNNLYEYMHSNNTSFSEAVNQEFKDISSNSASILKSRKIESAFSSGNQALGKEINQNIQQLSACCREETDPALSAEYQKIADQYSKANVYFSLASYL